MIQIAEVASPMADDDDLVGLDDVDAMRRELADAQEDVEASRQEVRDRQERVRGVRQRFHAAIVDALRAGARVNAVASAAGLSREQVRRVARANGVEAE